MGEFAKALADLDRAIELRPNYAWVIVRRGETYRQMGEFAKALTDLDHAIELEPNDDWFRYRRALIWLVMNESTKAAADLDTAITVDGAAYEHKSHDWRNTLHLALYRLIAGDQTGAEVLYRQSWPRVHLRASL